MRLLLAILMLFVSAAVTNAEHGPGQTQDDITLGSVRLTLGMPQDAVLAMLGKSFNLQKLGESPGFSSWIVDEGVSTDRLHPPKYIGNVAFRQEKLTSVMKNWAPGDQQKPVEFATGLYDVVTSLTNEGGTMCSIETTRKKDGGYDSKAIFVTCGTKTIRIDLTKGPERESVQLSEVLGE
jgi:hypothetical protein